MEYDLIFWQMEDDINFLANGIQPQFYFQMEDDHNFFNWKPTSIFRQIENDLNILANQRQPNFFDKWQIS
jgi:hypothetical protein